jgi:hypothetical protein
MPLEAPISHGVERRHRKGSPSNDRFCGAKTRAGTPCRRPAGWGTPNQFGSCRRHGGLSPTGMQHAARLEAEQAAMRVMGGPIHIEPHDALQFCIDMSRGEIAYCDRRIAELDDETASAPIAGERHHQELDRDGSVHDLVESTAQNTAQLHIWIVTRVAATERLARFSKMAVDAGVAERRVRLEEQQTEIVAAYILAVVNELDLTDAQHKLLPLALERHGQSLDVIEGTVA